MTCSTPYSSATSVKPLRLSRLFVEGQWRNISRTTLRALQKNQPVRIHAEIRRGIETATDVMTFEIDLDVMLQA